MKSHQNKEMVDPEPIHTWFNLSYASYLVIPRTLLQSCSTATQEAVCAALEKVYEEEHANLGGNHWPGQHHISVQLRDASGKFVNDPTADYQRGRRKLWQSK